MKCPRGRRMIDPCPRKVFTGTANACQACVDEYRAAVAKTCLLCPRKAAPGSDTCTACRHHQFPMVKNPKVCGKL